MARDAITDCLENVFDPRAMVYDLPEIKASIDKNALSNLANIDMCVFRKARARAF